MKQRPNVLMIAPAFAPNFFSEALVNSKLALAMLDAGWEVTVISAAASSDSVYTGRWEAPWEPLREIVHQVPSENSPGHLAKIGKAAYSLVAGRHPVPGALWASKVAEMALELHRQRPFELMLTRSTSCIAHLPGLIVKRETGLPWIANWNDPPSHLFPAPYANPISRLRRFFMERYLREAARRADVNTFPSERLKTYLSEPLRLTNSHCTAVLPHIGLGWRGCLPKVDKDVFRISHIGNLSIERDPEDFLSALAKTREQHPDVKFEFHLIGRMSSSILPKVDRLGLSDVVSYTPDVAYFSCLQHMESADALLLVEAPVKYGIFLPSKVVDYCEVGRPIFAISPRGGVMRDLKDRYDFGYIAEVGNPEAIAGMLQRLVSDWKEDRIGYAGLDELRYQTSPSFIVERLARLAWPNI